MPVEDQRERTTAELRRGGIDPSEVLEVRDECYIAIVRSPGARLRAAREERDWPSEEVGRRVMAAWRGGLAPAWRVLVFDPGVATGWSLWRLADDEPIERLDYGLIPEGLDGFLEYPDAMRWDRVDLVISERFRLGGDTPYPEIEPLRVEGAIASWAKAGGVEVVWQYRTEKAQVPDRILKEAGLWIENDEVEWEDARDVNDSQIHALAYAKTRSHRPTLEAYWPDE
jgi:hypothetical protein